ncbi:MAG: phosphatase PAP2 family protein [Burkholderiaceae bacterium]
MTVHALSRFLRARLSPEGVFGLHLTLGAALLLCSSILFADIAEAVTSAEAITILDVRLAQWLHVHASPAMTAVMFFITHMHSVAGISLLTTAAAVYLVRSRQWYWLLSLLLAVAGGMVLNVAMKYGFHRTRPSFADPLLTLTTFSFPSGHTAASTVFYGVLCCYLRTRLRSRWSRALIALAAVCMIVLVALSRMYLGAHYLSDVLAAMAEGVAWLALTITGVSTLQRRQRARAHDTHEVPGANHA